jgi:hypothetical protein
MLNIPRTTVRLSIVALLGVPALVGATTDFEEAILDPIRLVSASPVEASDGSNDRVETQRADSLELTDAIEPQSAGTNPSTAPSRIAGTPDRDENTEAPAAEDDSGDGMTDDVPGSDGSDEPPADDTT